MRFIGISFLFLFLLSFPTWTPAPPVAGTSTLTSAESMALFGFPIYNNPALSDTQLIDRLSNLRRVFSENESEAEQQIATKAWEDTLREMRSRPLSAGEREALSFSYQSTILEEVQLTFRGEANGGTVNQFVFGLQGWTSYSPSDRSTASGRTFSETIAHEIGHRIQTNQGFTSNTPDTHWLNPYGRGNRRFRQAITEFHANLVQTGFNFEEAYNVTSASYRTLQEYLSRSLPYSDLTALERISPRQAFLLLRNINQQSTITPDSLRAAIRETVATPPMAGERTLGQLPNHDGRVPTQGTMLTAAEMANIETILRAPLSTQNSLEHSFLIESYISDLRRFGATPNELATLRFLSENSARVRFRFNSGWNFDFESYVENGTLTMSVDPFRSQGERPARLRSLILASGEQLRDLVADGVPEIIRDIASVPDSSSLTTRNFLRDVRGFTAGFDGNVQAAFDRTTSRFIRTREAPTILDALFDSDVVTAIGPDYFHSLNTNQKIALLEKISALGPNIDARAFYGLSSGERAKLLNQVRTTIGSFRQNPSVSPQTIYFEAPPARVPAPAPAPLADVAARTLSSGGNPALPTDLSRAPGTGLVNVPLDGPTLAALRSAGALPADRIVGEIPSPGAVTRAPITIQVQVPSGAIAPVTGAPGAVTVDAATLRAALGNGVTGFRVAYSNADPLGSLTGLGVSYSLVPAGSLSPADTRIAGAIRGFTPPATGLTFTDPAQQLNYDRLIADQVTRGVASDLAARTVPQFGNPGDVSGTALIDKPGVTGVTPGMEIVRVGYVSPATAEAVLASRGPGLFAIDAPSGSAAGLQLVRSARDVGLTPENPNWRGLQSVNSASSWNYTSARINEGLGAGTRSRFSAQGFTIEAPSLNMSGQGTAIRLGNLQVIAAHVGPNGQGVMEGNVIIAARLSDINGSSAVRTLSLNLPRVQAGVGVGAASAFAVLPAVTGAAVHRVTEGTWDGAGGAAWDSQMTAMKNPVFSIPAGVNLSAAGFNALRAFAPRIAAQAGIRAGGMLALEAVPVVNIAATIYTAGEIVAAAPGVADTYEDINQEMFGGLDPNTATPWQRLTSNTELDQLVQRVGIVAPIVPTYLNAGKAWNIFVKEPFQEYEARTAYLRALEVSANVPQSQRFEAIYFDTSGNGRRNSHVNRLGADINTLYERNFKKPLSSQLQVTSSQTLDAQQAAIRQQVDNLKNTLRIKESFAAGQNLNGTAAGTGFMNDAATARASILAYRKHLQEFAPFYQLPKAPNILIEGVRDRGSVMTGMITNPPKLTPDGVLLNSNATAYKEDYSYVARGADVRPDPKFTGFSPDMKTLLGPDRVFYPNGFFPPQQRAPTVGAQSWSDAYNRAVDWGLYDRAAQERAAAMFGDYINSTSSGGFFGSSGGRGGSISLGSSWSGDNSWFGPGYNLNLGGWRP